MATKCTVILVFCLAFLQFIGAACVPYDLSISSYRHVKRFDETVETIAPEVVTSHPSVFNPSTKSPSPNPRISSTKHPSIFPSPVPSTSTLMMPSVSTAPSHKPTSQRSLVPTKLISRKLSYYPSLHPYRESSTRSPLSWSSENPSISPNSLPENSTKTPSLQPSVMHTQVSSSQPSSIPSITSITSSPTPSVASTKHPSIAPSRDLSEEPSLAQSLLPTISPSTNPTTWPSSFNDERHSIFPSLTLSTSPTSSPPIMPSASPITITSNTPSIVHTTQPSSHPSISLTETSTQKPSPQLTLLGTPKTVTLTLRFTAERTMNASDKITFQNIAKDFIEAQDALKVLEIYSITVKSQSLKLENHLNLRSRQKAQDQKYLDTEVEVIGTSSSPKYSFSQVLERVLTDDISILQDKLSVNLPMFRTDEEQRGDTSGGLSEQGEGADNSSPGELIVKIGAGIGAAGVLALVAFLYRVKAERGTFDPLQSNLSITAENSPVEMKDDNLVHENEDDVVSDPIRRSHTHNAGHNFDNRDVFSTLSYSDNGSSDFELEWISSSDMSEGVEFRSTLARGSFLPKASTENRITRTNFIPSEPMSLPVQQLRPQFENHIESLIGNHHLEHRSLDECSTKESVVHTEVFQPKQTGITKLLACFAANAKAGYDTTLYKRSKAELSGGPYERGEMSMKTSMKSNMCGIPQEQQRQQNCDHGLDQQNERVEMWRSDSNISAVSSLSGFSSFDGSAIADGDLYEVLIPNGRDLGLVVKSNTSGPKVFRVKDDSPLNGMVNKGDFILSIDGTDTRNMTAQDLSLWLHTKDEEGQKKDNKHERTIIFMDPHKYSGNRRTI